MQLRIVFLLIITLFLGGCSSFSSLKEEGKDIVNKVKAINSLKLDTLIDALNKLKQTKVLFISVANDYDILSDQFQVDRSDLMSRLDYRQVSKYLQLSDNLFLEMLQTIKGGENNSRKKIKNTISNIEKIISVVSKVVPVPNIIEKIPSTVVDNLVDASEKFKTYEKLRSSVRENRESLKKSFTHSSQVFKHMFVDVRQDIQMISKIAKKDLAFSKGENIVESVNKFKYQLIFNDIDNLDVDELEQSMAKYYKSVDSFVDIVGGTKNILVKDFDNILNIAKEVNGYLNNINIVLSRFKAPI